ncbi:Acetyltransferase (GNAT) family protein [Streptomyces sp. WMMB 714]|uniref:GNAT family N-acetyltransferase n=1 Tax=Streptomyces sp. WMMB 714 TaxID=1286822 RepID=UPI000823D062|nr:GNAT family N-acetyltransferase [Streptomyces sp. WMMB 714]SCK13299.1 Acetyltransferase (GNAT) family protein [Streptomyces sp. WMMB 714]
MEFTTGGRLEVRITASDVGKRVSVRSLTGSGGRHATFTDTVGVLTSWEEGVLHITRRGGQSVPIDEAALVAGKVVPPAPARRRGLPSAGVRELVEVAARGWPAVETERLGGWTLRASTSGPEGTGTTGPGTTPEGTGTTPEGGAAHPDEEAAAPREGFTARANSVLPLGDPGMPLDEAVTAALRWYGARNLVPRVQVTTGGERTDELLAAELERRGWSGEKHALLRVAALAPLADREPDPRVRLSRTPDEQWLSLCPRSGQWPEAAWRVLTGGPSVWFATVPGEDGRRADAVGRCVVDGRWAGFAAVEVAPARRREGLGTAVMAELARQALAEGASAAYLQVESANDSARALYDRLGFADHHAYHYRRAPQESSHAG